MSSAYICVGVLMLLSLAYLGIGPHGMPMHERARIPAIVFLACLVILALTSVANAQSFTREGVTITCEQIRAVTALERWAIAKSLGLTKAEIRHIKQTCNLR
jgi:hypothetical protein